MWVESVARGTTFLFTIPSRVGQTSGEAFTLRTSSDESPGRCARLLATAWGSELLLFEIRRCPPYLSC